MACRRKRALPPWLSGVTVGKQTKQNVLASRDKNEHTHVPTKDEEKREKQDCESKSGSDEDDIKLRNGKPMDADKIGVNKNINAASKHGVSPTSNEAESDKEKRMTAEEIVTMSYPEYKFRGSIIYSHNADDCNIICDEILSSLETDKNTFIGFDTEWPVTYQRGNQAKTALVQICLSEDKCYLFHVSCMAKFPVMLKKLIENQSIKKVGVNVEYDLWKIEADYDVRVKNVVQNAAIDLRTVANQKLKTSENWSLEGLTKNVLRMRLSKDPSVRTCDWSQYPLPEIQKRYAAADAVISLKLYSELMKIQR